MFVEQENPMLLQPLQNKIKGLEDQLKKSALEESLMESELSGGAIQNGLNSFFTQKKLKRPSFSSSSDTSSSVQIASCSSSPCSFVFSRAPEVDDTIQGSSSRHPQDTSELDNSESQDSSLDVSFDTTETHTIEDLSDDEKIKLIALQYFDSKQKFFYYLYYLSNKNDSTIPSDYELSDEEFKNKLLYFRKISLRTLNNPLPEDTEILNLNFKNWLEKKLGLFNDALISLKLDHKLQEDLDKQFNSAFPLPSLPDVAITHKSVSELNKVLESLDALNKALADATYEAFYKIEKSFANYPRLNRQEIEASQDDLEKKEYNNTSIQWLYAVTEKLNSFEEEIKNRIAKIENMRDKKVGANQAETTTDAQTPGAVYLPHSCSIIPNSDELNSSADFSVKSDAFYKQNALKLNQTLTFEHTLSANEKRIWSVTRTDNQCLAYTTHKPWEDVKNNIKDRLGYETSYVKEISFAQMIHAVSSFKGAKICTLQFSQCSPDMEKKKISLFIAAYNELRNDKQPLLISDSNQDLKMEKSEIDAVKTEIKDKLNLYSRQTIFATKRLSESEIILSPTKFRSRG